MPITCTQKICQHTFLLFLQLLKKLLTSTLTGVFTIGRGFTSLYWGGGFLSLAYGDPTIFQAKNCWTVRFVYSTYIQLKKKIQLIIFLSLIYTLHGTSLSKREHNWKCASRLFQFLFFTKLKGKERCTWRHLNKFTLLFKPPWCGFFPCLCSHKCIHTVDSLMFSPQAEDEGFKSFSENFKLHSTSDFPMLSTGY